MKNEKYSLQVNRFLIIFLKISQEIQGEKLISVKFLNERTQHKRHFTAMKFLYIRIRTLNYL